MVWMMKLIQHYELFTQYLVLQIQNMTRKTIKKCRGEEKGNLSTWFSEMKFSYVWESTILKELANKKQVIYDEMYQLVDLK